MVLSISVECLPSWDTIRQINSKTSLFRELMLPTLIDYYLRLYSFGLDAKTKELINPLCYDVVVIYPKYRDLCEQHP
jgi:hypothetical protein